MPVKNLWNNILISLFWSTLTNDFISLNTKRPWLIISLILLFAETLRASLTLLWRHDVRKFDADAILYGDTLFKKMDISMFLAVFSVRFWLESGKMCKNKSTFLIFTFFCRYSLFSTGRDQLLGRAGQENISPGISPRISPLQDFWIPGLDSSTWIGWYTAGPKVKYQVQY